MRCSIILARHRGGGYRSWWVLVDQDGDHGQDHVIGKDCTLWVADCSWGMWEGGSTPLLWQFPDEFRTSIRDGMTLWLDMDITQEY
jgi:hypothetical protein